jgi:ADP-heptose:LPS heptosyltransferase
MISKYIFKKSWKIFIVFIIDLLGFFIFLPYKIYHYFYRPKIKSILVIRLDQIGDVIQALPFFERIKNKFAGAKIYALVSKQTSFILESNKNIYKIFTFENSWFYKNYKINLFEIFSVINKLKKEKIDMTFDLRGDFRNIILSFLIGSKKICGYGCTGGAFLLTDEKKYFRDMHEIDKNLLLISEKSDNIIKIDFPTSDYNINEIKEFFNTQKLSDKIKKIVIHPFAGTKAKLWGFNNFQMLINKILQNHKNVKIFIIGSKEDKLYENFFIWNEATINCIGKFSLQSIIELIKRCDIYIGCDSGPQYFAAYSNKKTYIIYGYISNHLRWKPKIAEENFIGFSKPVDCGYCELEICPRKNKCMNIITPNEVYTKIHSELN